MCCHPFSTYGRCLQNNFMSIPDKGWNSRVFSEAPHNSSNDDKARFFFTINYVIYEKIPSFSKKYVSAFFYLFPRHLFPLGKMKIMEGGGMY